MSGLALYKPVQLWPLLWAGRFSHGTNLAFRSHAGICKLHPRSPDHGRATVGAISIPCCLAGEQI